MALSGRRQPLCRGFRLSIARQVRQRNTKKKEIVQRREKFGLRIRPITQLWFLGIICCESSLDLPCHAALDATEPRFTQATAVLDPPLEDNRRGSSITGHRECPSVGSTVLSSTRTILMGRYPPIHRLLCPLGMPRPAVPGHERLSGTSHYKPTTNRPQVRYLLKERDLGLITNNPAHICHQKWITSSHYSRISVDSSNS